MVLMVLIETGNSTEVYYLSKRADNGHSTVLYTADQKITGVKFRERESIKLRKLYS